MNKLIGGATPLDELLKNINKDNKIVFVFDVDNCLFSPPVLSIAKRKQYASEIISQNTSATELSFDLIKDNDQVYGCKFPGKFTNPYNGLGRINESLFLLSHPSSRVAYWVEGQKEYLPKVTVNEQTYIAGWTKNGNFNADGVYTDMVDNIRAFTETKDKKQIKDEWTPLHAKDLDIEDDNVNIISFEGSRNVLKTIYDYVSSDTTRRQFIKVVVASSADDADCEVIMKYLLETLTVSPNLTFMQVLHFINDGIIYTEDIIEPKRTTSPYYGEIGSRHDHPRGLKHDKNTHFKNILEKLNGAGFICDYSNLLFFDDNPAKNPLDEFRNIFKYHMSGIMTLDTGGWDHTALRKPPVDNEKKSVVVPKKGLTLERVIKGIELFNDYNTFRTSLPNLPTYNGLACKYIFWKYYKQELLGYGVTEDQIPDIWDKISHLLIGKSQSKTMVGFNIDGILLKYPIDTFITSYYHGIIPSYKKTSNMEHIDFSDLLPNATFE